MNPETDTSKPRVPLQGAVKIFEAWLKSKTWDIHGMPQFIMTTHREGCETCDTYASHVVEALEASMVEIPSREVEKAFRCKVFTLLSSFSLITIELEPDILYIKMVFYMTVVTVYDKRYICLANYGHMHACDNYSTKMYILSHLIR